MLLADAREAGRRALLGVQVDNADPAAAKRARRSALTFSRLAEHYVEQWAKPRKRSWRDDARRLRTIYQPQWGSQPASELTRTDVRKLLGEIVSERGGVSANRLHSLLSKLFRWAVAQGYLDANPMGGLPKPTGERSRERVLSDHEIRALWERLNEGGDLGTVDGGAPTALLPDVALWPQAAASNGAARPGDLRHTAAYNPPPHAATSRFPSWSVRGPLIDGWGRHGRGLSGARYAARPDRCDQGARTGPDQRPCRQRFEREGRAVAALSHPHICTLQTSLIQREAYTSDLMLIENFR